MNWDHPRVCGEKLTTLQKLGSAGGSPPRVRGKDIIDPKKKAKAGITPACAGKRAYLVRYACPYEDHPRVCGEKISVKIQANRRPGSPPRVRGKALPK